MKELEMQNLILIYIQTVAIVVTCLISLITFFRSKSSKRRQYVTKLLKEFINNDDLYSAMHIIEFKRGWFNMEFYSGGNNSSEKIVDRLFIYLNNIIFLYKSGDLNEEEFNMFLYKINAVLDSEDAMNYLAFINRFSKKGRGAPSSFQYLIDYAKEKRRLPD